MTIDPAYLTGLPLRIDRQHLTRRDTMLYALSVGAGQCADELRFVYEEGLQALPTMAVTLAYPGFWCQHPDYGIEWRHIVHAGQSVTFHAPLPVEGAIRGEMRIDAITDKGPETGALIQSTQHIFDEADNRLLATMVQISLMRRNGGQGSAGEVISADRQMIPDRPPDLCETVQTRLEQALLYRLLGDINPVHADPAFAEVAGFPVPILHGLCSYGFAGRVLLKRLCGGDPARMRRLDCRFTGIVLPGDALDILIWRLSEGHACFQVRMRSRDSIVIDNGYVAYAP